MDKIVQNTKKSPGDLRTLAVTQTPKKNHMLTLVGRIIPSVIGAFETVAKGLLKGLEDVGGRVEIIQTTALLGTARILRRVLET